MKKTIEHCLLDSLTLYTDLEGRLARQYGIPNRSWLLAEGNDEQTQDVIGHAASVLLLRPGCSEEQVSECLHLHMVEARFLLAGSRAHARARAPQNKRL